MTISDNPRPDEAQRLIPRHGGYRRLRSFRAALAAYDATVLFCDRFIDRRSRTHDQMVQAARSGVRNIEEGSVASATSKKTELKLTNVARASLEELMRDCEDFLRHCGLTVWDKDSAEARKVRAWLASDRSDGSDKSDARISPICPKCGKSMRLRTARQGPRAGSRFWGCAAYPECKGVRPADSTSEQPT